MFKPLKKQIREKSGNSSILIENDSEEINGNHDKSEKLKRTNSNHRRSNSNTHHEVTSNSIEEKEQSNLTNIVDNNAQILQSWIDSKEEILQQKDNDIQKLLEETNDLQSELTVLRNKLSEIETTRRKSISDNTVKTPYLQKQIDTLRLENENLKSTIKTLRTQLTDVEAERDDLLIKSTDITYSKKNNHDLENELKHLREIIIERDAIIEQQDKRLLIDHKTQEIQTDEDQSFIQVLAEPGVDTISKLQEELEDKNRTIKTLQERYNDLRKTLQREFNASLPRDFNPVGSTRANNNIPSSHKNHPLIHYDDSRASQSDIDTAQRSSTSRQMTATRKNATLSTSDTSPAILSHTTIDLTKSQKNGQAALNNTNLRYLKHVIIKFMTSNEDEAIHLIRAVSTLLSFSSDEERLLRETLEYKMSWFGKVTRLKPTS